MNWCKMALWLELCSILLLATVCSAQAEPHNEKIAEGKIFLYLEVSVKQWTRRRLKLNSCEVEVDGNS